MTEAIDAAESRGNLLAFPTAPEAIELRHLRAFVAVAEELNFGRAAARLHLSQPALSRQIQALERLVGCRLLRRSTRSVELTPAGGALLERARRLLADVDAAVSATQSAGGELAARVARLWAPMVDVTAVDPDLQAMRTTFEALHGGFAPPPEVEVRSVIAGGVPALTLAPAGAPPVTLLYVHGGGYLMGSAFGFRHLCGALAAAARAGALIPEYRLAPEHPFPAALQDVLRAYAWMLDQGVDAGRITVAGDSSGAGLVLSLLLSLRERDAPLPGGAVLMCPHLDLRDERSGDAEGPEAELLQHMIALSASAYLAGHPADDPVVDPLRADLTGLPPLLVQAATGDHALADAQRLAARARRHGVDVDLELYPGTTHGFQMFWSFLPEAADALQRAGSFARAVRDR
jgi:acetyl esterase/lipase